MSHVALAGADGHALGEPVHDLLDLLLCGGGVDLDVRMIDQDVVKVGHLQVGPFLAEQKGEAVLECSKIFRPRVTVKEILSKSKTSLWWSCSYSACSCR